MRTIVFHDLFGGWGWEQIDEHRRVCAESSQTFDSEEECLQDARRHAGQNMVHVREASELPLEA